MFASPAGCVTVTWMLAPPAFEVLAPVPTCSCGLNASAPQSVAWKGLERGSCAPKVESSSDSVDSGAQLVGFEAKCGPIDVHAEVLQAQWDTADDGRERAGDGHAAAVEADRDRRPA